MVGSAVLSFQPPANKTLLDFYATQKYVWNYAAKKTLVNNSKCFIWRAAILKKLKHEMRFCLQHSTRIKQTETSRSASKSINSFYLFIYFPTACFFPLAFLLMPDVAFSSCCCSRLWRLPGFYRCDLYRSWSVPAGAPHQIYLDLGLLCLALGDRRPRDFSSVFSCPSKGF